MFLVGVVSALALASCGGDDGGVAENMGITTDSSSDSGDVSGDPMTSISEDDMALAGAMLGLSEKCTQIYTSMMNAFAGLGAMDANVDPGVDDLLDQFDEIKDVVPSELRADVDIIKAEWARYGEFLLEAADNPDVYSDPATMDELSTLMSSPEFTAANERFGNWLNNECAVGS